MSQIAPTTIQNTVLTICGLSKSFGGQKVIDDLSADLRQGEIVLLRGENGAGKTTLLNILSGNLEPDKGTIQVSINHASESFQFPSRWWTNLNPFNHFTPERLSKEGIGRTWQDVRLFSTLNIRNNIAVARPSQLGENPIWAIARCVETSKQEQNVANDSDSVLSQLGLSGRELSSADKVSLGQSKRVAIARAIEAGAKILFLDEPLAGLDRRGIDEILSFLTASARKNNITMVIVEHVFNIPHILNIASSVWTLQNGKLTIGKPSEIDLGLENDATHTFKKWIDSFAHDSNLVSQEALHNGASLTKIRINGKASENGATEPVLAIHDLVVFRADRLVLGHMEQDGTVSGVSFSLNRGELAVLQAPNGWGKTTLMEALAGIIPIARGTIKLYGKTVDRLPPWQRFSAGLSLLQSNNNTYPDLTAAESLWLAGVNQVPKEVQEFAARKTSALSGGQKQRVVVNCMLLDEHFTCGLLDEPFSALDHEGIANLTTTLKHVLKRSALLVALPAAIITAH